jgi:hypothetical protein
MPANYLWAWVAVAVGAVLVLFTLARTLRGGLSPLVASLAGWWLFAVLVAPAEIPRYPGHFAPAFVVFVLESLFQTAGAPGPAGRILLAASALGFAIGLAWYLVVRRLRRNRAPA